MVLFTVYSKKKMMYWSYIPHLSYSDSELLQNYCLEYSLNHSEDILLFVEHPCTITIGSKNNHENLLLNHQEMLNHKIELHSSSRGGDVTLHAPGQLVIYPIFNLRRYDKDILKWIRNLEMITISTCEKLNIPAKRNLHHTGVWVNNKKIASIGVKIKKWVNLHGIGLNCNNDLSLFEHIIPCGIEKCIMTSISAEKHTNYTPQDVIPIFIQSLTEKLNIHEKKHLSIESLHDLINLAFTKSM